MRTHETRIRKLEQHMGHVDEPIGPVVWIEPDRWPEADRIAFEQARANRDIVAEEDIVERVTGQRPVLGGRFIGLIITHIPPGVSVTESEDV